MFVKCGLTTVICNRGHDYHHIVDRWFQRKRSNMDLLLFGMLYLGGAALLVFILLFGETPLFQGTPVSAAHWFLTDGLWTGCG